MGGWMDGRLDGESNPGGSRVSSSQRRRPLAPSFKLQKPILRFCAGAAEHGGLASSVFHISYTAHWTAPPHTVTAGHIYERCTPETYHWPDIAQAQRFESHPALYANSLNGAASLCKVTSPVDAAAGSSGNK